MLPRWQQRPCLEAPAGSNTGDSGQWQARGGRPLLLACSECTATVCERGGPCPRSRMLCVLLRGPRCGAPLPQPPASWLLLRCPAPRGPASIRIMTPPRGRLNPMVNVKAHSSGTLVSVQDTAKDHGTRGPPGICRGRYCNCISFCLVPLSLPVSLTPFQLLFLRKLPGKFPVGRTWPADLFSGQPNL